MNSNLKRLEILKNLILLEEEELIHGQLFKLKEKSASDEAISSIIDAIEKKEHRDALSEIESYLKKKSSLIIYEDLQNIGLKLDLKTLENQLESLTEKRDEAERIIEQFNINYQSELGQLIQEILRFRADAARDKQNEEQTPENKAAYKEARNDYTEFKSEHYLLEEIHINKLTEEELKDLKFYYRKASRLCHPDRISGKAIEEATEVFKSLNAAYKANDLELVKKILYDLEHGIGFASASNVAEDSERLIQMIDIIKAKIINIKKEIAELHEDETYQLIISIDDFDDYFNYTREQLLEQKSELMNASE